MRGRSDVADPSPESGGPGRGPDEPRGPEDGDRHRTDAEEDELVRDWLEIVSSVTGAQDAVLADMHRQCGVSSAAFVVLTSLREAPDRQMSMHLLAGRLGMTSGGFTKLADRLQAAELIERHPSSADRRVVLAVLTERGAESAAIAMTAYQRGLRSRVAAALPGSHLARLRASARRLAAFESKRA